jgi:steroid 5-alpha reductase family enzyme
MGFWETLLWGYVLIFAVLSAATVLGLRQDNVGVVDIFWTGLFGALAILYAWLSDGWLWRDLVVGALVVVWSFRLASHFVDRVTKDKKDGRLEDLREDWKGPRWLFFFGFYQFQGVFSLVLSVSFLVVLRVTEVGFSVWEVLGFAVLVIALVGEAVADRQLRAFKRGEGNDGKVCKTGFWRYSRHPNYFFQFLAWCSFPVMAIGRDDGWAALIGPAIIFVLLRFLSGVPPTEKQALKSRGEAYRQYQRETNAFFPGPAKTGS